jgi:hypothetical protein
MTKNAILNWLSELVAIDLPKICPDWNIHKWEIRAGELSNIGNSPLRGCLKSID